jgi:PAS domain S-box-containing protein
VCAPPAPWCCIAKWRARQRRYVERQLASIASEGRYAERLTVTDESSATAHAAASVNQLLTRLDTRGQKLHEREQLFQRLVESVHEAVVIHRETILYANNRFAALTGLGARDLIGRKLHELVPSEYADLVRENLRRRLVGEPAAERFEIELIGAQGQVSRLELASSLVDVPGEPLLLITAVEMLPQHGATAPEQERSRALVTLQAINEGVITTDKRGRIDCERSRRWLTGNAAMQRSDTRSTRS